MWFPRQLQSWPTPEMFITRKRGKEPEKGKANLALTHTDLVYGELTSCADSTSAYLGLTLCGRDGPINRAFNDAVGFAQVMLTQAGFILPQKRPTSDAGLSNLAMSVASFTLPQKSNISEIQLCDANLGLTVFN